MLPRHRFWILAALALLAGGSRAAQEPQTHRIGVLAHRPKPAILEAYGPTADYLTRALPGHRFEVVPLGMPELDRAVAAKQVDFVFTNPEHYIALELRHRITRIATIVPASDGQPLREFGGVVLVRADRIDLQNFADLRGRKIAAVDAKAFGGYLMQAGELLEAGVDPVRQVQVEFFGLPQDPIVQAVLDGRVDAGFVRTGVVEAMARDGKLRLADLRAVNRRSDPGFPYLLSTRLYPEWPFASTPDTPEELAKQVLVALLAVGPDSAAARRGRYHGWAIPLSYEPVHALMKSLRVAPYDEPQQFSLREVLRRYESEAFTLLTVGLLIMFAAAWRFRHLSRRLGVQMSLAGERSAALEREVRVRQKAEHRLAAENEVLDLLALDSPLAAVLHRLARMHQAERPGEPMAILHRDVRRPGLVVGATANLDDDSRAALEQQAARHAPQRAAASHPGPLPGPLASLQPVPLRGSLGLLLTSVPASPEQSEFLHHLANLAALAIEQSEAAAHLRLNASVFENALEGILVTDPDGIILDINAAFTRLTGYERHEVIGNNPRLLKSGVHDAGWYRELWQTLLTTGQWQGELWNRHKSGRLMAEILHISGVRDADGRLTHYVGTFGDITNLKETQARLERAATFDGLTGLPNRSLLTDRLRQAQSQARRRGNLLAICFLDLDNFKPVNDSFGHATGDALLQEVAQRLQVSVRAGDTVARLGGDEFVLLLCDIQDREEIGLTLERLLGRLAEPFPLADHLLRVSASIGVTVFPHDDCDPDALLRHADQAMYRAKQQGRNRFHLFDTAEDEQLQLVVSQQQRLRQALDRGELRLHYQPQVSLRDGRLVGVEALIRWQHPERGLLAPAAFLPAVEHHDLICDIGEWVIGEALARRSAWAAAGLPLTVSVNIAAHHFLKPDFVDRLAALLARHPDLPRDSLELEIVESAAFEDLPAMLEVVKGCRALGIRFALDDFGTGYSSLSYLKLLPADTLKIDRSFVLEMLLDRQSLAIVEGIISLASTFQRRIVAEGVETEEHGTTLLRLGCEVAQGYGIGRPMAGDDIPRWHGAFRLPEAWRFWSAAPWDLRDFPLLAAEVAHRAWVETIIAATTAGDVAPEDLDSALPVDQCGFGLWLDQHGRARYSHQTGFPIVAEHHRQVHQIAHRIVDCLEGGETHEAHRLIRPLRDASDQLLAGLSDLQRNAASQLG